MNNIQRVILAITHCTECGATFGELCKEEIKDEFSGHGLLHGSRLRRYPQFCNGNPEAGLWFWIRPAFLADHASDPGHVFSLIDPGSELDLTLNLYHSEEELKVRTGSRTLCDAWRAKHGKESEL